MSIRRLPFAIEVFAHLCSSQPVMAALIARLGSRCEANHSPGRGGSLPCRRQVQGRLRLVRTETLRNGLGFSPGIHGRSKNRSHGLVTSHVTVPLSKGRSYRSGDCADAGPYTVTQGSVPPAIIGPGGCWTVGVDSDPQWSGQVRSVSLLGRSLGP